jgi:hypothetical protein
MARPPRSSIPSLSGEPRSRRLGVGSSAGIERPLRAQLVVAGVAGVILMAVPLYLMRRPSGAPAASSEPAMVRSAPKPAAAPVPVDAGLPAPPATERVRLAAALRVKCGSSAVNSKLEGGMCDALPALEKALGAAIKATADCAPKQKEEGSINFVMSVDFTARKLHVFPGASGSWKGPLARKATDCVNRALPLPDWGAVPHQYRYYWIAIMATYPSPTSLAVPPGTPTFE